MVGGISGEGQASDRGKELAKLYFPQPCRNIERGYKLDAVIEELKRIDADVIAIQVLEGV
jgi:hypothetical protein